VRPGPMTFAAGTGATVIVTDARGRDVAVVASGGRFTTAALVPSTSYTFVAYTSGGSATATVTTAAPARTLTARIWPSGGTFGVGTPITVTFNHTVINRRAVERRLVVATTKAAAGAWSWASGTRVTFRPTKYWPAHTGVKVTANLAGVDAGAGSWGMTAKSAAFAIGRSWVLKVDAKSDQSVLYQDGKAIRSMGVNTGRPGYETRSGIKLIMEKYAVKRMTNVGVTTSEVYDLQVPYAMRLTDTGEFLHAAPWDHNIGYANTSHGCTHLSLANAHWVFDHELEGDVVQTVGTSRAMETWNGLGGPWNATWATWLRGSLTGLHSTGPTSAG